MKKKIILNTLLLAIFSILNAKNDKPNIIFLMADDMRFDHMGCMGNTDIKTPNLDKLGYSGVRFNNTYANTSICKASRATVMTGKYEFVTGCNFSRGTLSYENFTKSYPALLRENGYITGFAGKFGFQVEAPSGSNKKEHEVVMPFFDWWGGWTKKQGNYEMSKNETCFAYKEKYGDKKEHTTYALGMISADFIEKYAKADKPFCLSVSFKAPHTPLLTDPRYDEVYANTQFQKPKNFGQKNGEHIPAQAKSGRPYAKGKIWVSKYNEIATKYNLMIYGMDVAIGMIIEELEKQNIADNTVIIFTSDNGHHAGSKGLGGKLYAYEEGSRIPLIIYDPRHNSAGKQLTTSALSGTIDFCPTILDIANVPIPEDVQGKSLLPVLDNVKTEVHSSMMLISIWGVPTAHSLGVVTKDWKLIHWMYGADDYKPATELYDMKNDRLEMSNEIDNPKTQKTLKTMKDFYNKWLTTWEEVGTEKHGYPAYVELGQLDADYSKIDRKIINNMSSGREEKPIK